MKLHELLAVAGIALTGCGTHRPIAVHPIIEQHYSGERLFTSPVSEPPLSTSAEVTETEKQDVKAIRQDVIEPLKDIIYAGYDSFMGKRRRDYPQLEERLIKALNAAGMPKETYEHVATGLGETKELEQFFSEQGLLFRKVNMVGQLQLKANYELIKLGPTEQKERSVFGQTAKFTKVTVTEPELILNYIAYRAQKQDTSFLSITSLHWKGKKVVEYRSLNAEKISKQYYGAEKQEGAQFEAEAQDHTLLDKYDNLQKLLDRMGTLLHHVAIRDLYRTAKDEAEFVSKLNAEWERNAEIRGAMLCNDDFEIDKSLLEKLTEQNLKSFLVEQTVHAEMRALLAQMYEGNPHMYLGQIFKLAGSQKAELGMNHFSGANVVAFFGLNVLADRQTYDNIDVSGFEPGKETIIYKQFASLTKGQGRKLAKFAFDKIYEGRTLKEFSYDLLDTYLNNQENEKKKKEEEERKKHL